MNRTVAKKAVLWCSRSPDPESVRDGISLRIWTQPKRLRLQCIPSCFSHCLKACKTTVGYQDPTFLILS